MKLLTKIYVVFVLLLWADCFTIPRLAAQTFLPVKEVYNSNLNMKMLLRNMRSIWAKV